MKRIIFLITLILVLSVSIFLFFKTFFNDQFPPYAKEIAAAFLGTVITATITAVLLRSQSNQEISRDKSIDIFKEKLSCYMQFCTFLSKISEDNSLANQEELELREWSMKLALISGKEISDSIDQFFVQVYRYKKFLFKSLSKEEIADFIQWHSNRYGQKHSSSKPSDSFISVGTLISHLKHDLGEVQISELSDITAASTAVDDILELSRRKS